MVDRDTHGNPDSSNEHTEEAGQAVRYFAVLQEVVGFIGLFGALGVLIVLMNSGLAHLINLRTFTILWIAEFIPMTMLGVLLAVVGRGVRAQEPWSFHWSLYGNLITLVAYLVIGGIFVPLGLCNVLALLLLFTPWVRVHWWSTFTDDLKPRLKEFRYSLYLVRKSPLVVAGVVIIAAYVLMAVFAPYLVHYGTSPYMIPRHYDQVLWPPGSTWWFGTDYLGSDIYSSVIWGAQVDLRIAFSVVGVGLISGTLIGSIAGYRGGWLDESIMRITDVFFAFPGLILAMAIVAALGGRSLENVSLALMLVWWPTYARLVRGQVLTEREKLYVEAARSVGASDSRILLFHILPNTIQPVIVQATLDIGAVILTAAGLSFIGYGAEAGTAEWGLMISDGQRNFAQWWTTFFPGIAILFCSLAFNLVGDGVRDIMDPKLRRRT